MRNAQRVGILAAMLFLLATSLVGASGVNSYWQRMGDGFPNVVTVHEYVYELVTPELEISARLPQLVGVANEKWEAEFNQRLRDQFHMYVEEMKGMIVEFGDPGEDYHGFPYQGIVDFEVKLNQGGLLSLAIINYSFTGGAHGMTYFEYINVDLTSGHRIAFTDLFDSEVELERAAEIIDAKIKEEVEHFFIDSFSVTDFQEDQGFYLQDTQAVICFGLYELAPYAHGIQEFAIPTP